MKLTFFRQSLDSPQHWLGFGTLVVAALSLGAVTAEAQHENIIAIKHKDQITAWAMGPVLIKQLDNLKISKPSDAKQIADIFLSVVAKNGREKKECCYKLVSDNVWSCCDGTYVTTTSVDLKKVLLLASAAGPKTGGSSIDPKFSQLNEAAHTSGSFMAIQKKDWGVEQWARELSKDDKS